MRAMWSGSISFGLVNIPIKLFAATEKKEIKFRFLHKKCQTPLEYRRTCPRCQEEVDWDQISRGYEFARDHFVVIEEEELSKLQGQKTKMIEIVEFVKLEEIDPVYFDRSYYLSPVETGAKPYALLQRALADTGKIALAKVILRTREVFASIRPTSNLLVMETMYYPDEIRAEREVPGLATSQELKDSELAMAEELIERLTTSFEPQKYKDHYRHALEELIQAKIEGQEISIAPPPEREKVLDLMEALKASVEEARKRDKKSKKKQAKKPALAGKTK